MEETYVYLWLIHVDVWQKQTQFCKVIILQLKNKYIKKIFFKLKEIEDKQIKENTFFLKLCVMKKIKPSK